MESVAKFTIILVLLLLTTCHDALQHGDPCNLISDDACLPSPLLVCINGTCACSTQFYYIEEDNRCTEKIDLGLSGCTPGLSESCSGTGVECISSRYCQCQDHLYDNNGNTIGGFCKGKKGYGIVCPNPSSTGVNAVYSCITVHATCQMSPDNHTVYKCQCESGFYYYGSCQPNKNLGESCGPLFNNAQCADLGTVCNNNSACACGQYFYDTNGLTLGGTCLNMTHVPEQLSVSDVNSRAMLVSFDKPTDINPEDFFGYVIQLEANNVCVADIIIRCSDCDSYGQWNESSYCNDIYSIEHNVSSDKLQARQEIRVTENLKPDTMYTLTVRVINPLGTGKPTSTQVTTSEVSEAAKEFNTGVIIGAGVGGVVAVATVVTLVIFITRRKRKPDNETDCAESLKESTINDDNKTDKPEQKDNDLTLVAEKCKYDDKRHPDGANNYSDTDENVKQVCPQRLGYTAAQLKGVYEKILRKLSPYIIERMVPISLCDEFNAIELFPLINIRDIQQKDNDSNRNRAIVDFVLIGGSEKYIKFKECLDRTKQFNIVDELEKLEMQILNMPGNTTDEENVNIERDDDDDDDDDDNDKSNGYDSANGTTTINANLFATNKDSRQSPHWNEVGDMEGNEVGDMEGKQ